MQYQTAHCFSADFTQPHAFDGNPFENAGAWELCGLPLTHHIHADIAPKRPTLPVSPQAARELVMEAHATKTRTARALEAALTEHKRTSREYLLARTYLALSVSCPVHRQPVGVTCDGLAFPLDREAAGAATCFDRYAHAYSAGQPDPA